MVVNVEWRLLSLKGAFCIRHANVLRNIYLWKKLMLRMGLGSISQAFFDL